MPTSWGRKMFGGGEGAWDHAWTGWWGEDPPYHAPIFVLIHHRREPVVMRGGTTFTFVTDGPESALARARAAAGEKDVAIAGGASTVQQYLSAGMLDELYLLGLGSYQTAWAMLHRFRLAMVRPGDTRASGSSSTTPRRTTAATASGSSGRSFLP